LITYSLSLANVKLQLSLFLEMYVQLCGKCSYIRQRCLLSRKMGRIMDVITRKSLPRAKESNLEFESRKIHGRKRNFCFNTSFRPIVDTLSFLQHLLSSVCNRSRGLFPHLHKHFRAIMHFIVQCSVKVSLQNGNDNGGKFPLSQMGRLQHWNKTFFSQHRL
jgi:hypothetical protein